MVPTAIELEGGGGLGLNGKALQKKLFFAKTKKIRIIAARPLEKRSNFRSISKNLICYNLATCIVKDNNNIPPHRAGRKGLGTNAINHI